MGNSGKIVAMLLLAVVGALYVGVGAASDQQQLIGIMALVVVTVVCLVMGNRIWLLIPILAAVQLRLRIPGTPQTLEVAQILVTSFGLIMLFTKRIQAKFQVTKLELCLFVFLACVLQVYARNPVGLALFGGGSVGGRPYLLFLIALLSALFLSSIRVPYKDIKKIFPFTALGMLINMGANILGFFVPSVGPWIGAGAGASDAGIDTGKAGRNVFIIRFGSNIALFVSSLVNPLRATFHVLWLPLVLMAFMFAGLSGYRNVIVATGLTFLVGIIYRGGLGSFLASIGGLAAVLTIVAVVNQVSPLPPKIQRSLCFFPGTWEQRYIDEADDSTRWRVEIWEEVLLTDNWIQNKVMGDGLGFTREELMFQQELKLSGSTQEMFGFDAHRASILVNGDYHSGPVSAIRTIGYVGLFVMGICQLMIAYRAHKLIMRARGRAFLPIILIVCIPLIWNPLFFWFVFGGFAKDGVIILMGYGMVRLLENNLPFDQTDEELELDAMVMNEQKQNQKYQPQRGTQLT